MHIVINTYNVRVVLDQCLYMIMIIFLKIILIAIIVRNVFPWTIVASAFLTGVLIPIDEAFPARLINDDTEPVDWIVYITRNTYKLVYEMRYIIPLIIHNM